MKKNIVFNYNLETYKKKYLHSRYKLLKFSKDEIDNFNKKKKINKDTEFLLKTRKWALIDNTYYEIPKAPRLIWFRNLNVATKAGIYTLVLGGALAGGGYGIKVAVDRASFYKTEVAKVNEINNVLAEQKGGFAYPKLAVDHLTSKNIPITQMSPKSSSLEYGYDLANNEIVLVNKDDQQIKYSKTKVSKTSDVWLFKDEYAPSTTSSDKTYGTYLKTKSSLNTNLLNSANKITNNDGSQIEINFNSNLDVGDNKNCKLVFDSSSVTDIPMVVTNYGSLEINGSLDSVSHYGILNTLTIESLAGEYNEYGTVAGDVILRSGTFKAKEDSTINTIILDSADVKVEVSKDSDYVGTIAATKKEYITDTSVVIPEEKKAKIVVEKDKDVPLPDPEEGDLQGLGTEKSPYIIEDFLTQAAKITDKYANYAYYRYAGSEKEVDCSNWAYNGKEIYLNGQLDCNNITLNNLDSFFIRNLGKKGSTDLHKVSNLTINASINKTEWVAPVARNVGTNVTLSNITVHGSIAGTSVSSFLVFGASNIEEAPATALSDMKLTFENCISDATLIHTTEGLACGGMFINHSYCNTKYESDTLITYKNSIFTGKYIYPNGYVREEYLPHYFTGRGQNCANVKAEYSDEFISKYGNPEGKIYSVPTRDSKGIFSCGECPNSSVYKCQDRILADSRGKMLGTLTYTNKGNVEIATSAEKLDTFKTQKVENAKYATASLFVGPNDKVSEKGNYLNTFIAEEIENFAEVEVGANFASSKVQNYLVRVNKPGVDEQGIHGFEYDIYDNGVFYFKPDSETFDSREYGSYFVTIVQYNEDYYPIHIDHFNLKK